MLKAIINKSQFDLKKMGIQSLGEEFASLANNETLLQKTQRNVFKLTGFQFMDSFGKNVYLNSTWNRWMKYAKKNDPQLRKDISRRFEDTETIDQIMQDIKAGKMTPNVNLLLFMKLANIQPLTKSQMPAIYLNSPNGRISYAFKTFGIKQLDYLIQETKRNFQENPTPQALLKVVQMMMIIILLGASVDEIKDFSM
ncbi:MAG: hypothetical protein LBG59_02400 [Candidatus Peribacteria bacterium]|nr:hypothetical protein [Candidatus Peribacteria bacterium]